MNAVLENKKVLPDEAQVRQFHEEGYFILDGVVPESHLELLRGEADFAVRRIDADMDREGVNVSGINTRGKRYFSSHVWKERPGLLEFIKSPLMGNICRAVIGPNVFLFWEQYVIKGAEQGMKFSWHQDSGYVGTPNHRPYLTCWVTLDDVDERNGTVYLLPYSRSGIRSYVHHEKAKDSNDLVGYYGSDPGIPVIAKAGSIVCFSSLVFHCSGANTSPRTRRIYLPQYSSEIIRGPDGELRGTVEPVLQDGKLVDWRLGALSLKA